MRRVAVSLAILLASCLFQVGLAQDAQPRCVADHYKLVPLPLSPRSINNAGEVAGVSPRHRAAFWTQQHGLTELPLPPGFVQSEALAVNQSGHIAGVVTDETGSKQRAFLFKNRANHLLPPQSKASDMNDSDEIVGEALDSHGLTQPTLWKHAAPVNLAACCGGTALAINRHGEVVGQAYDRQGHYSAFLWDQAHRIQTIGPPGTDSSAIAINDDGEVLVRTFAPPAIYLYRNRELEELKFAPKTRNEPRALNRCGAVAGGSGKFSDVYRAFLWDSTHGARDLNELIPEGSGWKLEVAAAMNDRGEIVGWGDHNGEEDTGFLLEPQW